MRPIKRFLLTSLQQVFALISKDIGPKVKSGKSLIIAPHPDDETLGCGGVIALARAHRQLVRIIIVTDGAASVDSILVTPDALAGMRRAEAIRAVAILGSDEADVVFLNFPDGGSEASLAEIAIAIRAQIEDFRPAQVFSPYIVDGHPDHRAVAVAVEQLCASGDITCSVYAYPIWYWPHGALNQLLAPRRLSRLRKIKIGPFLPIKRLAMEAYRSQLTTISEEGSCFVFDREYLGRFFRPYELFFERRPGRGTTRDPVQPTA